MELYSKEDELSWLKMARTGKDLVPETREVAVRDPDQCPEVAWGPVVAATKEENNPTLGAKADRQVADVADVAVFDPDQGPKVAWGPVVAAVAAAKEENNPNLGAKADRLHQKFDLLPEDTVQDGSTGGILTNRRHQLWDEHFEMQLLLRMNQKFWKNWKTVIPTIILNEMDPITRS